MGSWMIPNSLHREIDLLQLSDVHGRMLGDYDDLKGELGGQTFVDEAWPRLWFGDLEAYSRSELRVITAALNPSGADFRNPLDEEYRSVRLSAETCASAPGDLESYKRYCKEFFETGRRDKWFGNFRKLLRDIQDGVDYNCKGSWRFGSGSASFPVHQAIHLDVFSPFATKDKWSSLKPTVKECLRGRGEPLFKAMVDILKPHLLLVGVSLSSAPSWMVEEENVSWFGPDGRNLTKNQARSAAVSVKIISGSLAVVGGAGIAPYAATGWSPMRRRELSTWLSSELTGERTEIDDDDCADLGHCALPWASFDSYYSHSRDGEEHDPFEE